MKSDKKLSPQDFHLLNATKMSQIKGGGRPEKGEVFYKALMGFVKFKMCATFEASCPNTFDFDGGCKEASCSSGFSLTQL